MQLSDKRAAELLKVWKDLMAENPSADTFVILRRIARTEIGDEKEQKEIVNRVSALRTEQRQVSWNARKVIGVLKLVPRQVADDRDDRDLSRGDLAAGEGVARRLDRMHDMTTEG